jgi:hypothetical protein
VPKCAQPSPGFTAQASNLTAIMLATGDLSYLEAALDTGIQSLRPAGLSGGVGTNTDHDLSDVFPGQHRD